MDTKAAEIIKQYLQPTEVLIWAGQPKKGIVFEPIDILKTIYILAFLVFTYFAIKFLSEVSILLSVPIGIIFFSAGFILGIGRFFIDAELRKKTFYGLTDKRIIIVSRIFPKKMQSVWLNSKPKIQFLPNLLNETSTIDIGLKEPTGFGKGGVSWFPNSKSYSYLYRLSEGDFVHKKIREITD
jgi:hypothetical protein